MGKKILIGFIITMIVLTIVYFVFATGVVKLPTASDEEVEPEIIVSVEDLQTEHFYIWHDSQDTLEHDLEGTSDEDVFNLCPEGTINWKKNKQVEHSIWFSSEDDYTIPTLYPGDELIYISSYDVPNEGITWERYADYGYSFGVANLVEDKGGHYRIIYDSDDGYEGYINPKSDATQISDFFENVDVFLDKVGDVPTKQGLISEGGTVLGLEKDGVYKCKWYKGSNVNDFKMTANQHSFCYLESFETYDFEFVDNANADLTNLHSCITIKIPEWLKTGYYYIENQGFFRYVAQGDLAKYNGMPYDSNVDWNDPIILYDDNHLVIYDPSQGLDKRDMSGSYNDGKTTQMGVKYTDEFYVNENPEENQPDEGAEEYEDFGDEVFISNKPVMDDTLEEQEFEDSEELQEEYTETTEVSGE